MEIQASIIPDLPPFLFKEDIATKTTQLENIELIQDVWRKIFLSASAPTILNLSQVNKEINCIGQPFAKIAKFAFGKEKWSTYFGDIGDEPPLPEDIYQLLESPCPFWSGKKVGDTHMLALVPSVVNGIPLTMRSVGDIIKQPKRGNASEYKGLHLGEYKDIPSSKPPYWVLMPMDIVKGTQCKSYSGQKKVLDELRQRTGLPYKVPYLLDVTLCIFLTYVSTGFKLYSDRKYTRCKEAYNAEFQLCVGAFKSDGLFVDYVSAAADWVGMAFCRKFR